MMRANVVKVVARVAMQQRWSLSEAPGLFALASEMREARAAGLFINFCC
jgi:hypothetical protein